MKNETIRFFTYCEDDNAMGNVDICEITENQFKQLKGVISYERHTIFDNGVNQVCLTIEPSDLPDINKLEIVK